MKKKKIYISIVCILIIIALGIVYFLTRVKDTVDITFHTVKPIEYGDKVDSKTFVKDAKAKIITYPNVNTLKVGKQTIKYIVKDGNGKKDISFDILIKDTKKPIITLKNSEVSIVKGGDFNPEENIQSVLDEIDGALTFAKKLNKHTYTIETGVDTSKVGDYKVSISAKDKGNNITNQSYVVHVVEPSQGNAVPNNTDVIAPTYIKGILIVNKTYGLPKDFGSTDQSAYAALLQLQDAASKEGFSIPTISGFRPYEIQVTLYNNYVARDGKEAADRYSARPGYSEHQSGLCFDIGAIDNDYGSTPAGKWLHNNCARFGYIIRYPNGKENITGYMYEPWHVRYVGVDVATQIMNKGITLEEYLGV